MKNSRAYTVPDSPRVRLIPYITLVVVILLFSGFFSWFSDWLGALDFINLIGKFGTMKTTTTNFIGVGGVGACQGFMFAFSVIPGIMLALGIVEVASYLGALYAAQKLLSPIMKPILGLSGIAGLALVSSLQSSDAGGAMTRELYENKYISDNERSVFGMFQFSAGAAVTNYLTTGAVIFPFLSVSIITPLAVILCYKVVGMNIMRLYLNITQSKEKVHG